MMTAESISVDDVTDVSAITGPPGVGQEQSRQQAAPAVAEDENPAEQAPEGQVDGGDGEQAGGLEMTKEDYLEQLPAGTVLEAAFVDPAYTWPPVDGEGKNAIELQASLLLLSDVEVDEDTESLMTTESMKDRMRSPRKPKVSSTENLELPKKTPWWQCCRSKEAVVETQVDQGELLREYQEKKILAKEARQTHAADKREKIRQKEKDLRKKNRYNRVPEGILIYRLDTSVQELSLMSQPHNKTNQETLVRELKVVKARPSPDKSRRGMEFVGRDGTVATLVACEQRTATAWLEAASIMLAKNESAGILGVGKSNKSGSKWTRERLAEKELDNIEDQYMNLAGYSNKLIRAGALPGGKKGGGGAGGIFYSVEKATGSDGQDGTQDEALEAIAKRRAVIKDSWNFYRMICSLLRDRNKYDEVFRRMQLDPVYPYLNSMTGLNDPGDSTGYENLDKAVQQKAYPEYDDMSKMSLARTLANKAEIALPSLVEICKALAGSLGMEEVGVGPVKEVESAVRKADKKYGGDLLKVTDYCRALMVVKDIPSLLALLELARDSFGPLIRRVKMSTLKSDHDAKPGGYRDCIINVELKDHICEIQVHIWPMWVVCGVDGYRHYRHCVEYKTDSFQDPYDALDGLDRKTMAELVVMAEEAVADTPLDNLEWYHENYILDYFAEAGLFMKHGVDVWAEITFRHLIRLRIESPDIGPDHHETIILYKYLAQSLRAQGKYDEADEAMVKVKAAEVVKTDEKKEAEQSLWDSLMNAPQEAYEYIVDPNRKEREEEEKLRHEVKASKKRWRRIRHERFPFLDSSDGVSKNVEEKKSDAR